MKKGRAKLTMTIAKAFKQAREEGARRLAAAAVLIATTHQHKLNVSNPRPYDTPSKPGEYPKKRTGFLQGNVMYEPQSLDDIARTLVVRIGFRKSAFYGESLAERHGRKGLIDTVEELRSQLTSILGRQS